MEKETIRPYLVQRANFAQNEHKAGIDTILQFDYMGSAEFEFGSLGDSLRAIRAKLDKYDYFPIEMNGKKLTVFCRADQKDMVVESLEGMAEGKFRTKEYTDFDKHINPDPNSRWKSDTDLWWDIENHFMVWRENEGFTSKFKENIAGTPK